MMGSDGQFERDHVKGRGESAHLQLIAREGRVGRTETQDIDDTAGRPRPHSPILVRQEMGRRQLLRNLP